MKGPSSSLQALPGANVIKLILSGKKIARDKHSSLVQKIVNYGQKSFTTLGPA
jgi:hypothetical protein